MPRIENVTNRRVIVRERALQGNPARLTLSDVRMPRRGNVDDLRSDEPTVLDSFQRAELQAIRDRQKLDAFVSQLPAPSLQPRLVRVASVPPVVPTVSDAGEADARIELAKAPRVPSIYNRHGLTSRGRVIPAGVTKVDERPIPGATVYPALPAQSTRFYAVRAKS